MKAVFVLLAIVCAEGAVFLIPNSVHPDHPGKCYYQGPHDVFIKAGESVPMPNECGRLSCDEDYSLSGISCGVVAVLDGCRNVIDHSKPYPDCCVNIVCD